MPVLYSPEAPESKERVKWEAQRSEFGVGMRPYVKREYPMMLHKAGRPDGGGPVTIVDQVEVGGENESETYYQRGFRQTPLEALAHHDAEQTEFMKLAGERAFEIKHNRISGSAASEVLAAEDAHHEFLPSVPVTPIKPRAKETK